MPAAHSTGSRSRGWWLFDPDGTIAVRYVNLEKPVMTWNDGEPAGVGVSRGLDIFRAVRPRLGLEGRR
jgi:hypothetical protein